ncbi:hypothetical protein LAZ67_2006421 [Cordylochernes scorpioides]|uniref:Uncharacterized protein n=1 Tax=Cordylochernes scorpioides TaxID=51811 RepID=A0ABY6K6W2_9ARAC|nr:hypothetical protein LAZ67_2006421 [Cordylochernes scorpioides]
MTIKRVVFEVSVPLAVVPLAIATSLLLLFWVELQRESNGIPEGRTSLPSCKLHVRAVSIHGHLDADNSPFERMPTSSASTLLTPRMSNKRSAIIELFGRGKRRCEIVRLLKVSQQTVSIHRFNELCHEGDRGFLPLRKRTANTSANRGIIKKRRNSREFVRKISRETDVNKSSVHRIAKKERNLKTYKLQKVQFLTDENKRVRLERSRQLKHRATGQRWELILFTDEKLFTLEQTHNHQNDRSRSAETPSTSTIVEHRQNTQSIMAMIIMITTMPPTATDIVAQLAEHIQDITASTFR